MEEKRASSFQIRLQNKAILFRVPRLHPDSDWSVAGLSRKLLSLLSNGSSLIPKLHLSAQEIAKQAASVFSQANLGFYAVGPKSKSCTPPTNPRTTRTPPKLHVWPAAALEQVGFCLD